MPSATKKTSISLDHDLEQRAKKRAEELGFKYSFSSYITTLIKEDLKTAEPQITPDKPEPKYPVRTQRPRRIPKSHSN